MSKKEKKKMNTYLKYGLILAVCLIVGGMLGYNVMVFEGKLLTMTHVMGVVISFARENMLMELLVVFVLEVVLGEYYLNKIKKLGEASQTAEDEEGDIIDYELEKAGAMGIGCNNLLGFLAIVILSTGYSLTYIKEKSGSTSILWLLAAFVLFVIIYIYNGYWGVRMVKYQQKLEPSHKGDPASRKFAEEWLQSCDEAEQELIYQSAYKSYQTLANVVPIVMVITMLAHMIWNTGIMAIVATGFIWLLQSTSYCRSCVQKRKMKCEQN